MTMHLAYRRMPITLRVLVVLVALHGVVRIGLWVLGWFSEAPQMHSRLTGGVLCVASAVMLFRGNRLGLSWLLGYYGVVTVALGYGLARAESVNASMLAIAGVLVVFLGYLAWCWQRLPWRSRGSYGHWMTDPDFRGQAAAWFVERDRVLENDRRSPPDPDVLVRGLLDDVDTELTRQRLNAQGELVIPAVLRALDDPEFRRHCKHLMVLIHMVPEGQWVEALPQLVATLPHVNDDDRGELLRKIATTGKASLKDLLVAELAGEASGDVAEGLGAALSAGRAEPELVLAVEPALRACVAREDSPREAHVTLARIDPETTVVAVNAALLGHTSELQRVIELADAGLPLPEAALLLWRQLRAERNWFWCWRLMPHVDVTEDDLLQVLAAACHDFGSDPDSGFEGDEGSARACYARALERLYERQYSGVALLIQRAVDMQLSRISDKAMGPLLRLHGLSDDWNSGPDEPTLPQRHLRVLSLADSYTFNGGMSHTLDCLDIDALQALESALEVIAPPEVREVWLEALKAAFPEGLVGSDSERKAQLMARYDAIEGQLADLTRRYERRQWRLTVAMGRYALAHRDQIVTE
jgi:hypothetical protein